MAEATAALAPVIRRVWQTVAAILLTHIVWVAVQLLFVSMLFRFFSMLPILESDKADLLYTLFGAAGAAASIIATRSLCDRLLRDYAPRMVAIVIATEFLLSLLGAFNRMRTGTATEGHATWTYVIAFLVALIATYLVFYRARRYPRSDRDCTSIAVACVRQETLSGTDSGGTMTAVYHPTKISYIYNRYKRVGDETMDESYFPVLWREDGYRTAWLDEYMERGSR